MVRVREFPARERVGAEPRVEQRQRALGERVVEVGEVLAHLRRREHALVGELSRGERRHVEVLRVVDAALADRRLEALADHVELALEGGAIGHVGPRRDEHVVHPRLHGAGRLAEAPVVGRHAAPAEQRLALLPHDHRENQLGQGRRLRVGRAEHQAHGVPSGGRQRGQRRAILGRHDPALDALALEQAVRNLDQDARAVARIGFGARRAAVLHALERPEPAIDDVVRGRPAQMRKKADATGVVLERRVIQAALRPPGQLRLVHWGTPLTWRPSGTRPAGW